MEANNLDVISVDNDIVQMFWARVTTTKEEQEKDPTLLKIESLQDLPEGWDYGQGVPSSKSVARKAKQIFSLAKLRGFKSEALPTTGGGIIMVLSKGDFFLDVVVNPDLSLDVRIEKGIGSEFEVLFEDEDVSKADVLNLLNDTKRLYLECLSSAPYTKASIVHPNIDSPQKHLDLSGVEFQYSMQPVLC